ncbi:MAG: 4-phosphopantetheinyl transferase family protein [Opitutaceae bacterium]|nr:4-phosphopantetheinyl transferase family protein [Opitutaceae bacterium]
MSQSENLRDIVAKLGGVGRDAVTPEFSLEVPALKGSLKRAALTAAIRRDLGINCRTAHLARTFGELTAAVFETAPSATEAPSARASAPVAAAPVVATAAPRVAPLAAPSHPFSSGLRCGADIELVAALPEATDYREHEFYKSHFSPAEIAYCVLQSNPRMHFAARWCAKEALYKAEPALRATPLSAIEVVRAADGGVSFQHAGAALPHALSLSHTETQAVALVVAPLPAPAAPAENAPDDSRGSALPFVSAVAWLIAVGIAVLALIRTAR